MVSMPSVAMKPLTRSLRIRKPLIAPMTRPTSRQTGIEDQVGNRPMPWKVAGPLLGSTSHIAMTGATPMVDSSDRSIRPHIRIIASASTSRLSSLLCWSTPIRLSEVRNTGDTMKPMTPSTKITGISDRSR